MDFLFLFFTVFWGVGATISFLNNSAKIKLRELDTTEQRISFRKQLYKDRIKTLLYVGCPPFLMVLVMFFEVSRLLYTADSGENEKNFDLLFFLLLFFLIIVLFFGLIVLYVYFQYKGNLSYLNKEIFLKENENFVLYLRGFENDDYSSKWALFKNNTNRFSEYRFTKALSNYYTCAAIGMTNELDAPLGATRIYADDFTWKDDVSELIEKANAIFILINNRPSCIWEIQTAIQHVNKVVFLIDDSIKYGLVQEEIKDSIIFPHIQDMTMSNRFYFLLFKEGTIVSYKYTNTKKGYKELIELSMRHITAC